MSEWRCVRCGGNIEPRERVGRRDTCPHCEAELHSCRQCSFYDPTAYNHCHEPQAERVLEKDRANFCDYYAFGPATAVASVTPARGAASARDQLDSLFRKK